MLAGAIAGGSAALDGGATARSTDAARPAWWMILADVAAVLVLGGCATRPSTAPTQARSPLDLGAGDFARF